MKTRAAAVFLDTISLAAGIPIRRGKSTIVLSVANGIST
jgi:hypothetical protein